MIEKGERRSQQKDAMNAQVTRKRIISLKIIFNFIFLITLCCSTCIECYEKFPKHNDVIHDSHRHKLNTPHIKQIFFYDNIMMNRSQPQHNKSIVNYENFNSNPTQNYSHTTSHQSLIAEKPLSNAFAAKNENLKLPENYHYNNRKIHLRDISSRNSPNNRPTLWNRKIAKNFNRRFQRIHRDNFTQSIDFNHFIRNSFDISRRSDSALSQTGLQDSSYNIGKQDPNQLNTGKSNIVDSSHNLIENERKFKDESTGEIYDKMPFVNYDNIRNRRESSAHIRQHQQQQLHPHHQPILRFLPVNRNSNNRQKRRKYCSARDPQTLAYVAPTVFEGKIKSMTSDRQANFSATLEILKVHKQQAGFSLPRQVRLQFAYKNSSECDIYREDFRHRGYVRDELEQGKVYYLFVKQISLGNFTILGQPVRKNNRTQSEVVKGVNEKYGEY